MNEVFVRGFLGELEKIAWKRVAAGSALVSIPGAYYVGREHSKHQLQKKHRGEHKSIGSRIASQENRALKDTEEVLRLRKKVFRGYQEGLPPGAEGFRGLTLREQKQRWPGMGKAWKGLSDRSRGVFRKDWEQIHGKTLSPDEMEIEYTRWNTPEDL